MVDLTAARKGIEMLYDCTCQIEELQSSESPETGITEQTWKVILSQQPCKRSIENVEAADKDNNVAIVSQVIRLFMAPEITVLPGSRITVTDKRGSIEIYESSGKSAVLTNHQEIILKTRDRWA